MKLILATLAVASGLVMSAAKAEVMVKSATGFVIEIRADVDSTPAAAYRQFLRVNEWWDANHSWFGDASNFTLDDRVGGCFCEIAGDRQALHMTISYVEPDKEIRMLGGLGPLQMMGVHGAMSWLFEPLDGGSSTTIVQRYTVSGYYPDGLDKLATIVDQVQSSQLDRLVTQLTTGNPTRSPAQPAD